VIASDEVVAAEDSGHFGLRDAIRLIGLIVLFLVVPMVLIGAMIPAQGCGGG
jgi:hypothetical protein